MSTHESEGAEERWTINGKESCIVKKVHIASFKVEEKNVAATACGNPDGFVDEQVGQS